MIFPLGCEFTIGPIALEQLLARVQGAMDRQATVCFEIRITAGPITAEWSILGVGFLMMTQGVVGAKF